MVKKQHQFFFKFCTESFESDLNIYVFICSESCNQIITQSGKQNQLAQGGGGRLPEKVVTDVLAYTLGFSGVNFCLGITLGFGR